jgi:hypothetical protein
LEGAPPKVASRKTYIAEEEVERRVRVAEGAMRERCAKLIAQQIDDGWQKELAAKIRTLPLASEAKA